MSTTYRSKLCFALLGRVCLEKKMGRGSLYTFIEKVPPPPPFSNHLRAHPPSLPGPKPYVHYLSIQIVLRFVRSRVPRKKNGQGFPLYFYRKSPTSSAILQPSKGPPSLPPGTQTICPLLIDPNCVSLC